MASDGINLLQQGYKNLANSCLSSGEQSPVKGNCVDGAHSGKVHYRQGFCIPVGSRIFPPPIDRCRAVPEAVASVATAYGGAAPTTRTAVNCFWLFLLLVYTFYPFYINVLSLCRTAYYTFISTV
jgi:hypothetical protein